MSYSTIYDMASGEVVTDGVQSQRVCDATIIAARSIAARHGRSVIVEDHGTRRAFRVTRNGCIRRLPKSWLDIFATAEDD